MFINSDIIKMADREKTKYFKEMSNEEVLLFNAIDEKIENSFLRIKSAIREDSDSLTDKEIKVSLANIAKFVYTAVTKANDAIIEAKYPTINNTTIKSYDTIENVIDRLSDDPDDVDSNMENIINEENKNN